MRLRLLWLLMIVGSAMSGCSGPTQPTPIASIQITAPSLSLASGTTLQLTVSMLSKDGKPLADRVVSWSSSNSSLAAVSTTGLVTASNVFGGTAESVTITASAGGITAAISLSVTPVPVGSLTVNPATAALDVGATRQLTATVMDAAGTVLTGRTVSWGSADTTIATITASGLVTARAYAGALTRPVVITATSEGKSGTATISVKPSQVASVRLESSTVSIIVGETMQLVATPQDSSGSILTGRRVSWTSSAPSVAAVSEAGLVTAVAIGSATITVTVEGQSAFASVSVVPPPPRIAVTSSQSTVMAYNPFTITWTTENTVSCEAVGPWSGTLTSSGSRQTLPMSTGAATYGVRCLGVNGQTATGGTTVTVAPATSFPENCALTPVRSYAQPEYLIGSYKISNNSWGYDQQREIGADTTGGYHTQCVSGRSTALGIETTIRWNWDNGRGDHMGYGYVYPNVFYGVDPNMRGSSFVDLPKRVTEVGPLSLKYDVSLDASTDMNGMFQLLHEAWFVSSLPASYENIVMEMGITTMQRHYWYPAPVDSVVIDNVLYDVMPSAPWYSGQPRVNLWFVTREDHLSGTIDFPKFIDYVVRHGYLAPTAYLSVVQTGHEIFYGRGQSTITMKVNR